jgi:hypothetical protein
MLKDLVKMASKLDALGLSKEADTIDALIRKIASNYDPRNDPDSPMYDPDAPTFDEDVPFSELGRGDPTHMTQDSSGSTPRASSSNFDYALQKVFFPRINPRDMDPVETEQLAQWDLVLEARKLGMTLMGLQETFEEFFQDKKVSERQNDAMEDVATKWERWQD